MSFYHTLLKESETRLIPATCKEDAWDYSRTALNPGDYVWELLDRERADVVGVSFRRGNAVHEDSVGRPTNVLPPLGAVVAYSDTSGKVRFIEPFSYQR